jgi:hypothetical protein
MAVKPRPRAAVKRIKKGIIGGKKVLVYPHVGTQLTVMESPNTRSITVNRDQVYRLSLGGMANGGKRPLMVRRAESIDWESGGKVKFSGSAQKTTDPRHVAIYNRFGRKVKIVT